MPTELEWQLRAPPPSMPHYMVMLHALLNLIFSFTVAFNNNKIILEVIYTCNFNNNILTSKAYN
jgi:hypothetical protein